MHAGPVFAGGGAKIAEVLTGTGLVDVLVLCDGCRGIGRAQGWFKCWCCVVVVEVLVGTGLVEVLVFCCVVWVGTIRVNICVFLSSPTSSQYTP